MMLALVVALVGCDSSSDAEDESGEEAQAAGEASDDGPGIEQADIPDDQTMSGESEGGDFYIVITPEPNPIPFQELFELDVQVYEDADRESPAEGVELDQLRAEMPAHDHGMNNEPTIEKTGEGEFLVEGMRFHMQGDGEDGHWVVEAVLNQNGTIDRAKFDVQCCRE